MAYKKTIKEVILNILENERKALSYRDIYKLIISEKLYDFGNAKTPQNTVNAILGDFIRNNDSRVKRVKQKNEYIYYLSKFESEIKFNTISEDEQIEKDKENNENFKEKDLHILLSSFLRNQEILTKTIFHEQSTNRDSSQKWIHPDMVGVKFLNLKNSDTYSLLKITNPQKIYTIYSYELKKEIVSDYDLKKNYFQTVSNSSWANYGYLVAFTINSNLFDEMERLNDSFGIGIIELKANPFESKILFPAKIKELDFKTIDKLCNINEGFKKFIEGVERILTADERFLAAQRNEFLNNCDKFMVNDSEIKAYCKSKNIPLGIENEEEE